MHENAVLVAVGGNSLIRAGQRGTVAEQLANARLTAVHLADVFEMGYRLVVTHGNGPQVGSQLLRSEAGSSQTYYQPLDVCVAATQGEIGYILQSALQSELRDRARSTPIATIVTRVRVNRNDPAFLKCSKPIGPFYHKEDAELKREELGWEIMEDSTRGYRRVVPSPEPVGIVEIEAIRRCLQNNIIVIAVGGGGIPVVEDDGNLNGVEAVIDKDKSSALLANELGLKLMIISTDVDRVYLNYKKAHQQAIDRLDLARAKDYIDAGVFPNGSMRPKIEAAIDFIGRGGEEVVITDPSHLSAALAGEFGTRIRRTF